MRIPRRAAGAVLAAALLAGCSAGESGPSGPNGPQEPHAAPGASKKPDPTRIPGLGALQRKIPAHSTQVVTVYGTSRSAPDATVALYTRSGTAWHRTATWPAHNGRRGWTPDHHEGDKRSPVGVFTLSDAGGVLSSPGVRLPYTRSTLFRAPSWWKPAYQHDFDLVIAIDYNRVKGTSPLDPTRPLGRARGGGIWLHLDHGSGTSGCVSLPKTAMRTLLRTLDPARHPVIVMGDRATLAKG
ncbi:L,D-transpeptidase family protein [Streptomyces smaragdinus]|nr:L,D-transpeptidase family protein [Streptomyces smaragdinus]